MRVKARAGAYCAYCKRTLTASTDRANTAATRDHINPQHIGGPSKWVPCCRKCNMLKGGLPPQDWFWFIDNHPRWWKLFDNPQQVVRVVSEERVRRVRVGEHIAGTPPLGGFTSTIVALK